MPTIWWIVWYMIRDAFNDYHIGVTAENPRKYGISRELQDALCAQFAAKPWPRLIPRLKMRIVPIVTQRNGRRIPAIVDTG